MGRLHKGQVSHGPLGLNDEGPIVLHCSNVLLHVPLKTYSKVCNPKVRHQMELYVAINPGYHAGTICLSLPLSPTASYVIRDVLSP